MRRSAAIALIALAGSLLTPRAGLSAPIPSTATWTQVWFPSQDGTKLRADVMLPKDRAPDERHPVILSIGPYFGRNNLNGNTSGPVSRFADLWTQGRIFERGYAYVQVDSRGYGGSGGCNDFGGPGEQSDTEAAVAWAARQPWSNGNVGMWGKSYDGWTQVMALAENPNGLKAAVIQAPLIETYRGMFMNGVHYESGWYATPSLYAGYDLAPPSAPDAATEERLYPATGTATNPHCYAKNITMTTLPDHSLPYWRVRDIVDRAAQSEVPVLWVHGFNDVNTKPDNFLPVYDRLRGPKRAWVGQWDHVRGNESSAVGRLGFMDEAMAFFDQYLKGAPAAQLPAVEVQNGEGWWRTEAEWPPADATAYTIPLRAGSYVDRSTLKDWPFTYGSNTVWTFTPPAPYDLHFAGEPVVTLDVNPQVPNANAIVVLYDVDPDTLYGRRITRGASAITRDGSLTFALHPQDWILREGHRLGIAVMPNYPLFYPTPSGGRVDIASGTLSLDFLQFARAPDLSGGPARAMSRVDTVWLDAQMIQDATVTTAFPPQLQ